jgi:hypothetical protein
MQTIVDNASTNGNDRDHDESNDCSVHECQLVIVGSDSTQSCQQPYADNRYNLWYLR